jgi:IstB-like ATP binding protein
VKAEIINKALIIASSLMCVTGQVSTTSARPEYRGWGCMFGLDPIFFAACYLTLVHVFLIRSSSADLLVLDDWGPNQLTTNQHRDLMEIIEDRYGRGATLITSHLPVDNGTTYGSRAADDPRSLNMFDAVPLWLIPTL